MKGPIFGLKGECARSGVGRGLKQDGEHGLEGEAIEGS